MTEMQKTIPAREEIDPQFKWTVEDLYATEEAWQADFAKAEQLVKEGAAFQGRLGEGWQVMRDFFRWQEESDMLLEKLYLYASMRRDENNANALYQGLHDQIEGLAVNAGSITAFFTPEVLALPEEQIEEYLSHDELKLYRRVFDAILRTRPHVLSPQEETLLAQTGEMAGAFRNIYTMLTNADMEYPAITDEDGQKVGLSAGNYIPFLRSRDRRVRREAFEAKYDTYAKFGNTIAMTYAASVKKDNFYAQTAKFGSALQASMFGDNVEESVYRNLIATVRAHLGDFHRYLRRRKELLGLDELHMYDVYVPLFPEPSADYSWEQAKQTVLDGLQPLGEDYRKTMAAGFADGWVDVYENKGKTSGAYSTGFYGSKPYILMNYQNDLNSVFTLAHEGGHSMHSWYSREAQPYVYADYRIFVAEVASTVNENLLSDYLIRNAKSEEEVRYLTNHYLEEFRGTVIRQTMFAEFELMVHEEAQNGGALTAERLCEIYYGLNKDYFGSEVVVDDRIAWEWARIPHFYRNFYVYKYATGFSAASALALGLLEKDPAKQEENRKRYLQFLSAGSSKDPLDLLADAGVDMRTPQPVEQAFTMFQRKLEGI